MEGNALKNKIIIIISAILLVVLITSVSVMGVNYSKIYRGISSEGIPLGGLTQKDAEEKLNTFFSETPVVKLKSGNDKIELNFADYGEYNFKKTAQDAYKTGRKNLFDKIFTFSTPFVKRNVNLISNISEESVKDKISEFQSGIPDAYIDTSYEIDGDKLIIYPGKSGKTIDTDKTLKEVLKAFSSAFSSAFTKEIEVSTKDKKYDGIDINKIYKEVHSKPVNASVDEKTEKITPSKNGYDFDVKKAKQIIKNANESDIIEIDLLVTEPEITLDMLTNKFFKDTIATYKTYYSTADSNRASNVSLAASKINGTVLNPGEVFSYNGVVGNRTASAGFKSAHVYVGSNVVDGIGGGICQVSSTLYNAVLYSNLGIVSRTNHSLPVSYVPKGQDATVSWGTIDFKFKNTLSKPIKISADASGGVCTVSILGTKENNYKINVLNTTVSTIPFETEYTEDETLSPGTEKIIQRGVNGCVVVSARQVIENGKVIKTESLPKSTYLPTKQKVLRNTKTATTEPEVPAPPVEETPEESTEPTPELPETPDETEQPEKEVTEE